MNTRKDSDAPSTRRAKKSHLSRRVLRPHFAEISLRRRHELRDQVMLYARFKRTPIGALVDSFRYLRRV